MMPMVYFIGLESIWEHLDYRYEVFLLDLCDNGFYCHEKIYMVILLLKKSQYCKPHVSSQLISKLQPNL